MPSKYDQYWAEHLDQLREGAAVASSGGVAKVTLQGLTDLGDRASWLGAAEVRGSQVISSSMAHTTSLAKVVAGTGVCAQWPEQTIRFTINTAGDVLTIRTVMRSPSASPAAADDLSWMYRRNAPVADNVPSRSADMDEFYAILARLSHRVGGPRQLRDCTARSGWPSHGVYFFFEDGELRSDGNGRVVRIGTHAVNAKSQSKLWGRLRQHRGHEDGGGNHRASIFRSHVGTALIRREKLSQELLDSWLAKHNPTGDLAAQEDALELQVSNYIGAMPFLWLAVPEHVVRDYIERNSIALLSRCNGGVDAPSANWLGYDAKRPLVRASGLWNVDYVDLTYDSRFLEVLARLVSQQLPS